MLHQPALNLTEVPFSAKQAAIANTGASYLQAHTCGYELMLRNVLWKHVLSVGTMQWQAGSRALQKILFVQVNLFGSNLDPAAMCRGKQARSPSK